MNKYMAYYRRKSAEISAETLLQAKEKAVAFFMAKRPHEVTVVLAEKNGETVSHSTAAFG